MDWQCFDYKVMDKDIKEFKIRLEQLSSEIQIQVILVKLWDLGKYIKL